MKECTGHEKINMDQKETKKMKSVYKVCLLVLAMLPAAFSLGAQPKKGTQVKEKRPNSLEEVPRSAS